MVRLHFSPSGERRLLPPFLTALSIQLALAGTLLTFPAPTHHRDTALSHHAESRAKSVSHHFQETELAANFLANERVLTPAQRRRFSSSGLAHLLAVSGGQLTILLLPVAHALGLLSRRILPPLLNSLKSLRIAAGFERHGAFALALFFASLFGAGGALLRVAFITHFVRLPFVARLVARASVRNVGLPAGTAARAVAIAFIAFFHGSPFRDPSFLLSASGAALAMISSRALQTLFPPKRNLVDRVTAAIRSVTCTSLVIALALAPLSPVSPLQSSAANLLALPLVNFWITPLSLAVLLWPGDAPGALCRALDGGLGLLHSIASAFGGSGDVVATRLFTREGMIYLSLLCIAAWSASDARDHRGLRRVRRKLLKDAPEALLR